MNGKDLFEGMSYVDERFVDEAENKTISKPKVIPWLRAASMAACLCLILFGLHYLFPNQAMEGTEGADDKEIANQNPMENVIQDSQINVPENLPGGEIPNVILYVEEMTAEGFIATVTEFGETQRLGLATKLNVVIAEGTRSETADGDHAISGESQTDLSGCYVLVQFFDYDPDTATMVADSIQVIDEEG